MPSQPLTEFQEWLWRAVRSAPGSTAYIVPTVVRLQGPLEVARLTAALETVVNRHDSLRTVFESCGQRIRPAVRVPLPVVPADDPGSALATLLARPMDLAAGPVVRPTLMRCGAADHVLLVEIHHLVFDAFSQDVVLEELRTAYAGAAALPQPVPQIADFLARRHALGSRVERQLAYWRRELAGLQPFLPFPGRIRPAPRTFDGDSVTVYLDAETCAALRECCRRYSVSPFIALASVYFVLLARVSGRDDVAVACQTALRADRAVQRVVGYLVNLVVLRADTAAVPGFAGLLGVVRGKLLSALVNADAPYARVADVVDPAPGPDRLPVTEASFNALPAGGGAPSWPGLSTVPFAVERTATSRFDLDLYVSFGDTSVQCVFSYRRDVVDSSTVREAALLYRELARRLLSEPGDPAA